MQRPAGLLGAAALALLLHALLLGGVEIGAGGAEPPAPPPPVQVRSVTLAAAPALAPVPAPAPAAVPAAAPAPPPRPRAAPRPARASEVPAPAASAPPAPAVEPPVAAVEPEPSASAASLAAAPASAPEPAEPPGDAPPPVYATVLPPSATLEYELRRGRLSGTGTLAWQQADGRYSLQLDGSVIGLRVLTQGSQGRIDAHGLAPERFTDQRARRAVQAANFRREAGLISFSGPTHELPLHPGVQDRLSWLVQLPAIVEADPARRVAGARIVLQVVGARGDAALWTIEVLGPATLDTPAGPVPVLHLQREPRGPYDTRVEVWLDPARGHLPLRATLRSGDDDALELRLR